MDFVIISKNKVVVSMTTEDLHDLASRIIKRKAEAQTVEVKSAHQGCPRRLYDTLSSFSNQAEGGVIVFGLDERAGFAPVGVYDLQDLQKKVTEQCQQMAPPVRAVFTMTEWEGKPILSAEIPGLDYAERPCYYKGAGRVRGSFIRTGDADLPMTDYELYRYEAFRKHIRDDERVVPRGTLDALDPQDLAAYVAEKKKDHPRFAALPQDTVYEMLNITRKGQITLAALMNFGIYPQSYFPQLAVTAISVPGQEIGDTGEADVRFLDNRRIEGNLKSMMEESLAFCMRNMKRETIIDKVTGQRKDRTEYPIAAIREAVLNALIHRDYSVYTEGTPVQIDFFSNRLEIHSPGGLYGRMTVEELGIARPDLRNPTLAVMAEAVTESENRYSGIPTMRKEMAAAGLAAPLFENRRGEFVVTFFNSASASGEEPLLHPASTEERILRFCQVPRSKQEIADFLGLKTAYYAMARYIRPLIREGLLKMTEPGGTRTVRQKYYS